jgi:flagellar protein FlaG
MNIDPLGRAVAERGALAAGPARAVARPTVSADAQAAREAAAQVAADRAVSEALRRAMAEANRQLVQKGRELTFEFDEDARRVIVKLIDTRTGEVLRQIPSEEALAIARALHGDTAAGALLRADA